MVFMKTDSILLNSAIVLVCLIKSIVSDDVKTFQTYYINKQKMNQYDYNVMNTQTNNKFIHNRSIMYIEIDNHYDYSNSISDCAYERFFKWYTKEINKNAIIKNQLICTKDINNCYVWLNKHFSQKIVYNIEYKNKIQTNNNQQNLLNEFIIIPNILNETFRINQIPSIDEKNKIKIFGIPSVVDHHVYSNVTINLNTCIRRIFIPLDIYKFENNIQNNYESYFYINIDKDLYNNLLIKLGNSNDFKWNEPKKCIQTNDYAINID